MGRYVGQVHKYRNARRSIHVKAANGGVRHLTDFELWEWFGELERIAARRRPVKLCPAGIPPEKVGSVRFPGQGGERQVIAAPGGSSVRNRTQGDTALLDDVVGRVGNVPVESFRRIESSVR